MGLKMLVRGESLFESSGWGDWLDITSSILKPDGTASRVAQQA